MICPVRLASDVSALQAVKVRDSILLDSCSFQIVCSFATTKEKSVERSPICLRSVVNGECTTVDGVEILTEPTGLADEFYGNIGQNSLSSFTSFTLDFNAMQFITTGGSPGDCPR